MDKKKEFYFPIKMNIKVTEQDIDDIMVGALEGGIVYWCCEAEVVEEKRCADWGHEQIARGGALILHDNESDDKWELNLENFLNGIRLWIENGYAFECGAVESTTSEYATIDCCQVDAIEADRIVQYALFGEIVFG